MKKKSFKKNKIAEKSKKLVLSKETKKGILSVILFSLSILSVLSFWGGAGLFGQYFLRVSQLFFGRALFLVPVSFALFGLAILIPGFSSEEKKSASSTGKQPHYLTIFFGIVIFVLSVLGIFHVLGAGFNGNGQSIRDVMASGSTSGGYLGLIIGYPLVKLLSFWASLVVLIAFLTISVLITFNISLIPSRRKDEASLMIKEEPAQDGKTSLWQKIKEKTREEMDKRGRKEKPGDRVIGKGKEEVSVAGKPIATLSSSVRKRRGDFKLPSLDYLEKDQGQPTSGDIKANINIIKRALENFGIEVEMAEVNVGPTVTQYTLRPAQGIKLSKITTLQNDLSLALAAHPLRIEAPIPGKSLVGIEIPNRLAVIVRLRALLERPAFQENLGLVLALGRDVAGNPIFADLADMPHLLVAGATGTGKTVALNSIITSLLYQGGPEEIKLILIDPKRVELTAYDSIPHLLSPVIVQPDKAVAALRWAVSEMERRFAVLQEAGKRDIRGYNKVRNEERLPYIIVIIDELADLMSSYGREAEASIVRLAQMARAVGIHLIVSTQRPSVEVITGLIKANITSRMAFQVASQIDSRTVLDMAGAEKLLGNGDMLFLSGSSAKPRRIQGGFISDKEIKKVVDYLKNTQEPEYKEEVILGQRPAKMEGFSIGQAGLDIEDELYQEAKQTVVQAKKASASLLQRRLRVGYARAARLLDVLEERGIIGPADGAKPRDVYIDEGEDQPIE
ncbi:MAG: DNA translocase FtsK 4TM domain-containing protein [Candidatus Portnoybacteria bacterium]